MFFKKILLLGGAADGDKREQAKGKVLKGLRRKEIAESGRLEGVQSRKWGGQVCRQCSVPAQDTYFSRRGHFHLGSAGWRVLLSG